MPSRPRSPKPLASSRAGSSPLSNQSPTCGRTSLVHVVAHVLADQLLLVGEQPVRVEVVLRVQRRRRRGLGGGHDGRMLSVAAGVAPLDEFAHDPEVVAAAVAADARGSGAGRRRRRARRRAARVEPACAPQVRSISSGSRPTAAQCSRRMPSFLWKASTSPKRVPHVRVLGDELERDLRAAAADQDRELAERRRVELAEALLDARQRRLAARAAGTARRRTRSRTRRSRAGTSRRRCRGSRARR